MSTKISHRPHRQMSDSLLPAGVLAISGVVQVAASAQSRV